MCIHSAYFEYVVARVIHKEEGEVTQQVHFEGSLEV